MAPTAIEFLLIEFRFFYVWRHLVEKKSEKKQPTVNSVGLFILADYDYTFLHPSSKRKVIPQPLQNFISASKCPYGEILYGEKCMRIKGSLSISLVYNSKWINLNDFVFYINHNISYDIVHPANWLL